MPRMALVVAGARLAGRGKERGRVGEEGGGLRLGAGLLSHIDRKPLAQAACLFLILGPKSCRDWGDSKWQVNCRCASGRAVPRTL